MVGVAGKSKGCATCRRRKIKCDLELPSCDRCKRSNLDCEGYDRYPVFINKTAKGVQKRLPLEEAKARTTGTVSEPTCKTTIACDEDVISVSKDQAISHLNSPSIEAARFIAFFCETFVRTPPSRYALRSPSHWLNHVFEIPDPQPSLRQCLLAVSVAKYGTAMGDGKVVAGARRLYTHSLSLLQTALVDPNLALHDDTLATAALMVLYELMDSTTCDADGWLNHIAGTARLLEYRGPDSCNSDMSRASLEHTRYLIMVQGLHRRKSSVLSRASWLKLPWKGVRKSVEQQVFDEGLLLGALFERADAAHLEAPNALSLINLIQHSATIQCDIQRIVDDHIVVSACLKNAYGPPQSEEAAAMRQMSTDPAQLILCITAISIELGACTTGSDIYDLLESSSQIDCVFAEVGVRPLASSLASKCTSLACVIVHLSQNYILVKTGAIGAARLVFALRLARQHLTLHEAELAMCDELLDRFGGQTWQFGIVVDPHKVPLRDSFNRRRASCHAVECKKNM